MNFEQCFNAMQQYQKTAEKIILIYQQLGALGEKYKNRFGQFSFTKFSHFRGEDRMIIHCEYNDIHETIIIPKGLLDNYTTEKAEEYARETVESLLEMEKKRASQEEQEKEITLLKKLLAKYPQFQ